MDFSRKGAEGAKIPTEYILGELSGLARDYITQIVFYSRKGAEGAKRWLAICMADLKLSELSGLARDYITQIVFILAKARRTQRDDLPSVWCP